VINEETGKPMEYKDLLKDPKYREDWSRAAVNEFGRLFNGVGKNADGTQRIVSTNTCHWIIRIPVMAPILAPLFGVLFLRGCFSLKNRT
jgi:hypothetical protein